jgi:hypothetical protein
MPGQILPDTESRDLTRSSRDFVEIIPASIARPSKAELEELNGQLRELTGRDPRPGQILIIISLAIGENIGKTGLKRRENVKQP